MKKILAIVIAALTVLTVVPFAVLAAPVTATANWLTDNVNAAGDTFTIDDVEDLYAFLTVVDTYDFTGKTVKLTADITVPDGAWDYTEWPQWFAGTFDGQDHTITNFKGFLFYRLSIGGTLKNVTFKNWSSLAKSTDTTKRAAYLINTAYKNSNVTNVTVDNTASTNLLDGISLINTCLGNVTGVTVLGGTYLNSSVANSAGLGTKFTNVYSNATVKQSTNDAWGDCGGIVNRIENNTSQLSTDPVLFDTCWFDGTVTIPGNSGKWAGGILSLATNATVSAKMLNCLNTGVITCGGDMGGLAGGLYGDGAGSVAQITFEKSANLGKVQVASGEKAASSFIHYVGYTGRKAAVSFTDCYALTGSALSIQPARVVEGLATVSGTITELDGTPAKYETALQTLTDWSTLQMAGDKTIIVPTYFKTAGIVKDVISSITISTADDWKAFLDDEDNTYEGVTVKLNGLIDVSGVTGVGPIKNFKGTFDGQDGALLGVKTGIFETLSGSFSNVTVQLAYFDMDTTTGLDADMIVTMNGTMENVTVSGYLHSGTSGDPAISQMNLVINDVNGKIKNLSLKGLEGYTGENGRLIANINDSAEVDGLTLTGEDSSVWRAIGLVAENATVKNVSIKDFNRTVFGLIYGTIENVTIENASDIAFREPKPGSVVKNLVIKNLAAKTGCNNFTLVYPSICEGLTIDGMTVDETVVVPLIQWANADRYMHKNMTIKNLVVNNGAATLFDEVQGTIDGMTVTGNTVAVLGKVADSGSVDTSKITVNNNLAPVIAEPAWPAASASSSAASTTAAATTAAATTAAGTTAAGTTAAGTTAAGTTAAGTTAAGTTAAASSSSAAASSSSVAASGSSAVASSSSAAATSSSVETGDATFTLFVIGAILLSAAAFAVASKARS